MDDGFGDKAIWGGNNDHNGCRVHVKLSDYGCIGLLKHCDCDIGGSLTDGDGRWTAFDFYLNRRDEQIDETRVEVGWIWTSFGLMCRLNGEEVVLGRNSLTSGDRDWMAIVNIGDYDGRC